MSVKTIKRRKAWPKWARYLTVDRSCDMLWSALPEYGGISCRWGADLSNVKCLDVFGQATKIIRRWNYPIIRRIVP